MKPSTRRGIQVVLAVLLLAAAVRLVLVYQERKTTPSTQKAESRQAAAAPLDPDYYVIPRKVRAYDAKSLREVKGKPAWTREGYRYTYYPLHGSAVDMAHEGGTLAPIERINIDDVITSPTPGAAGQHEVMLTFRKNGDHYAIPVGVEQRGEYQIFFDEMFFIQDPRELYKHWPPEVWEAVARHEIRKGMNEIQASFAVGMGVPQPGSTADQKAVRYGNGGHPLTVLYRSGKAAEIKPAEFKGAK